MRRSTLIYRTMVTALIACGFLFGNAQTLTREDTSYELYLTRIAASEALLQLNNISEARSYLDACQEEYRGIEWDFLNRNLDQSAWTLRNADGVHYTCVAMSPKGDFIAAGSSDSTIAIFTAAEKKLVRHLTAHTSSVSTVAFSNDGLRLVSGGRDHRVIVWDVATGQPLVSNDTAFSRGIYQVRFSPDDSVIGVVSWELTATSHVIGFLKILDAKNAVEVQKMETDAHPAAGVVFTAGGSRAITSTWGEKVYSFNLNTREVTWNYDLSDYDEYNAFHSIALSPDGQTLAVGSTDHRIHLLHAGDGHLIRRIEPWEGHAKTIKALAFSPGGRWLASAGEDQTILVWDVAENRKAYSLIGHTQTVTGLCWSTDEKSILSTSLDGTMKQWDLMQPFVSHYTICDFGPWQVPVSSDATVFAAPCSDKNLALYDIATGKEVVNFGAQNGLCADLSDDGRYLVTSSFDKIVRLFDIYTGGEIRTYSGHTGRVDGVAFMNTAENIISAGDTTLRIWSVDSLRELNTIPLPSTAFRVVLSPDEQFVFAGSSDGMVTTYDTKTWTEARRFSSAQGLTEMTISPDGNLLAVFTGRNIDVWNAHTGELKYTLSGHLQGGYGLGFSPDSRYLITGSYDQTFRIWDLKRGVCTLTYHGYGETIYSTRFVSEKGLFIGTSQGLMRYYVFR